MIGREDDPPMPFAAHLVELRQRLIWSLTILVAGAALVFQFLEKFLNWLARPVGQLVFIAPAEAFHARYKLAFYGGFLLTLPLLLHQLWLFVARALSREWRTRLLRMVPLSYGLFMAGVLLCLYLVVPAAMRFFMSYGSEGVRPLISLDAYLSFVTTMSLAFGAVFQFPVALYILNWMGVLDKQALRPQRRLVYFLSFIVSAFLTSDLVGQFSLASCTIMLFELTMLAMR